MKYQYNMQVCKYRLESICDEAASSDESSGMIEDDDPSTGYCDDCGEELCDDFYTIDGGIFCRIEHICPDCYRKRYGLYECYQCGEEYSSKDVDWDHSDKDEDAYICRDCSYKR